MVLILVHIEGTNPLVTYPRILGHEIVGRVIESGIGMPDRVRVGDRVIVDPYVFVVNAILVQLVEPIVVNH